MTFDFRDAVRQDVPLLILLAGGTGSGKTESALRIATGLSAEKPFAVIDTEHGRALHKADDYKFKHAELEEPFTPERYAEAIKEADAAGFPVIVIDSGSHEYDGIGGVLEIQLAEFERMGKREGARMASWIEPKRRHKLYVRELLRTRAHVIVCHRAEDKVEIVKDGDRTVVRPKASLVGAEGWIPICEKRLPFEATVSFLLTQANPGVPIPIKLERRHADLIPLDEQLSEETGKRLAAWAAGAKTSPAQGPRDEKSNTRMARADTGGASEWADEADVTAVLDLAAKVSEKVHANTVDAIAKNRVKSRIDRVNAVWIERQRATLTSKLPADQQVEPEQSQFAGMVPESARGGS